jgi:hypothetical protein
MIYKCPTAKSVASARKFALAESLGVYGGIPTVRISVMSGLQEIDSRIRAQITDIDLRMLFTTAPYPKLSPPLKQQKHLVLANQISTREQSALT